MAHFVRCSFFLLLFFHPWITQATENVCGGIIEESSGVITSPGFPEPYPANISCVWDIHAPFRSNITLILNSVDLDSNPKSCPNGDYLQVWGELNGQTLWRSMSICGNISQALVLRNVDNRMRILFRSDATGQRTGFSASFTSMAETSCGGELSYSFGDITSPGYPDNYPADKRCVWDLSAPPGHIITLNFTDFELENKTSTCPDQVVIWSRLIGRHYRRQVKYCGSDLPPLFTSTDNKLRVEFKSDRTIEGGGFAALFYSEKDRRAGEQCNVHQYQCNQTLHCIPLNWLCDGTDDCGDSSDESNCPDVRGRTGRKIEKCTHAVTSSYGEIISPLYRVDSDKGVDCSWYFKTLPGHKIKIMFHDFAFLEYPDIDQDCNLDRVTFFQGPSRYGPMTDYFCGLQELPLTVVSVEEHMLMTLKTNKSTFWKGFNLTHSTECGGEYEATQLPSELYSHPEFGKKDYSSNISCTWIVHAQEGKRVELNFTTFEVCQNELNDACIDGSSTKDVQECTENDERECGSEANADAVCENDFVELTEDRNSLQLLVAQFCGRTIPARVVSTDNKLIIRFNTNGSGGSRGFSATFRAIDEQQ